MTDIQGYKIKSYEADFQVCLNGRELNVECGFNVELDGDSAHLGKLSMVFVDPETLVEVILLDVESQAIEQAITPLLSAAIHEDSFNYYHEALEWEMEKSYDYCMDR